MMATPTNDVPAWEQSSLQKRVGTLFDFDSDSDEDLLKLNIDYAYNSSLKNGGNTEEDECRRLVSTDGEMNEKGVLKIPEEAQVSSVDVQSLRTGGDYGHLDEQVNDSCVLNIVDDSKGAIVVGFSESGGMDPSVSSGNDDKGCLSASVSCAEYVVSTNASSNGEQNRKETKTFTKPVETQGAKDITRSFEISKDTFITISERAQSPSDECQGFSNESEIQQITDIPQSTDKETKMLSETEFAKSNSLFDSLIRTSSPYPSTFSSTKTETIVVAEFQSEVKLFKCSSDNENFLPSVMPDECYGEPSLVPRIKLDISSDDEEPFFDAVYTKSGAESSSSKDESGSRPSCSGTSRTSRDVNSLSSDDSDNNHPSLNLTLPIKKRKREIEIISGSSSGDEASDEIDYKNLTPEQIKSLIEEARRFGKVRKKCKCPKKKWTELPIVGPTQSSGKCTIGKGDWSEKQPDSCPNCVSGICSEVHNHGRRGRKRAAPTRIPPVRSRIRGTIGEDVPIIEISDSEDVISLVSNNVASEVTIPAVHGECIVLSSSEDDDDIVCEAVFKTDEVIQTVVQPMTQATALHVPNVPQITDAELWPDLNIDLGNLDEAMSLLNNIGQLSHSQVPARPQPTVSAAVPERPSTPEGWSCPICLESKSSVTEIMSTTCGHVFCGSCIRSAVRIHKKCPTCRKKLTMKQFHKIFL